MFLALWFPSCVLVTTYRINLRQPVNEHRMHLSFAGVCALVGPAAARLFARFSMRTAAMAIGGPLGRPVVAGLVVVVLLGCELLTSGRNAVWARRLTLHEVAANNGAT